MISQSRKKAELIKLVIRFEKYLRTQKSTINSHPKLQASLTWTSGDKALWGGEI